MFKKFTKALLCSSLMLTSFAAFSGPNFRFSPIGLINGEYKMSLDFPVSENWTLGPTGTYRKDSDDGFDVDGYGLGIRGNYYINRKALEGGWYFGPSLQYVDVKAEENFGGTVGKQTEKGNGIKGAVLFGYQWMWDSFNITFGVGPTYSTLKEIDVKNPQTGSTASYEGDTGYGWDSELSLGWKF